MRIRGNSRLASPALSQGNQLRVNIKTSMFAPMARKFDLLVRNLVAAQMQTEQVASVDKASFNLNLKGFDVLNRVLATTPGTVEQLTQVEANLDGMNRFLAPLGFRLAYQKAPVTLLDHATAGEVENLKLEELGPTEMAVQLSALEIFRRHPNDVDEAIRLCSTGDEAAVIAIFDYELVNPSRDIDVLNIGFNFYSEQKDWPKAAKHGEAIIEIAEGIDKAEIIDDFADYIAEIVIRIAGIYHEKIGNLQRAKILLDKLVPSDRSKFPPPSANKIEEFFDCLHPTYSRLTRYRELIAVLTKMKNHTTAEVEPFRRVYLLDALGQLSFMDQVSEEELLGFISEFQELISLDDRDKFKAILKLCDIYLCWIHYQLGNVSEARSQYQKLDWMEEKYPYIYHALDACILEAEGKHAEAVKKAQSAKSHRLKKNERREIKLLIITVEELLKPKKSVAPSPPSPAPATVEPAREATPVLPEHTIDEVVFRDKWQHYYEVFPKNRNQEVYTEFRELNRVTTELLEEVDYQTFAGVLNEEIDLDIPEELQAALQTLGIERISISWIDGIEVTFHPIPGIIPDNTPFSGHIDENYQLRIQSNRDLKLADNLLQSVVMGTLIRIAYDHYDFNEIILALKAQPQAGFVWQPPVQDEANAEDEAPAEVNTATAIEPVANKPAEPEVVAEVEEAAEKPENHFFQINTQAFTALRQMAIDSDIDLMEINIQAVGQALDLIDIIESIALRRDQAEDPNLFHQAPIASDPLAPLIRSINILGQKQSQKNLEAFKISDETAEAWGFADDTPSNLLSLVEIELSNQQVLVAIINRNGDLIIPGIDDRDELVDQIHRTAIETLGRVTVPILGELFRIANLPRDLRRDEITQEREKSSGPLGLRSKILPALVILNTENTPAGVTRALSSVKRELQREKIDTEGVIGLPLFTEAKGIYTPLPENQEERRAALQSTDPDRIFVQERRGYTYRLPLGMLKTTRDNQQLLPYAPDTKKTAMAGALDLTIRPYLYAVVRYEDDQILFHPKASIFPKEALPPATREEVEYVDELLGGFRLRVYPTVALSLVDQLTSRPEVFAALHHWQLGNIPEIKFADPKRREALEGLAPLEQYFLIMPTNRGYYQGQFTPLSEYQTDKD